MNTEFLAFTSPYYVLGSIFALGGFLIATYIRSKKTQNEKLVCPIGSTCDSVIHSSYSKFLGIPIEVLGMFYYGIVSFSYAIFVARPELATPLSVFVLTLVSFGAVLFSIYLTFIQSFALKAWCTWCLFSAGISVCILLFSAFGSEFFFIPLLGEYREVIIGLHVFGMALGLGGATISDIMFFKFLKDLRISEFESGVLRIFSQIIWVAVAVLVTTGLLLYLPEIGRLNDSAKFFVKMIVVGVIIANGSLLNLLIAPQLVKISFGKTHEHHTGELHHIRKLAFALGAISATSWYSAFILGLFRFSPANFSTMVFAYATLLFFAIIGSQVLEKVISRRSGGMPPPHLGV